MTGMQIFTPHPPVFVPSPASWDAFVRAHPRGHALQLAAWADLKAAGGWSARRVALADPFGNITAGAQILFRPLPLKLGTLAYLPFGPLVTPGADVAALWRAIDQTARERRAAFLKCEPGIFEQTAPDMAAARFRPSPHTIQPPRTILIDLTGDEAAILARMNQGTRRKIRAGDKHGVRVWQGTAADVPRFTAMLATTGERNAFGVHDARYYGLAYNKFVTTGDAALWLAEHDGDDLAGVMTFAVGSTAWYLYGASSNVKRNLMGAYAAQWAAIQWARSRGCTTYDLWGIPDADEDQLEAEFESRSDGLWGVYGFKRGWGGRVVRSLGAWDRVYVPLVYTAYQLYLKRNQSARRGD